VDITVYLPDEIGKRAKAAEPELNLSRLLRYAVGEELARRERVAKLINGAGEHELDLETTDGDPYTGVLTGVQLTEESGGVTIYLTNDERLMAYDENSQTVEEVEDVETLRDGLGDDDYITVCAAVGLPARVEV
jgi:hypothetical protein